MVKKILRTTNPKLRTISKPVEKADKKLLALVRDLEETLRAQKDPEGLGLAAAQIGVFQRVFILQDPKGKIVPFINPEILEFSKKTNDVVKTDEEGKKKKEQTGLMEGCLSLPHYYGPVRRSQSIKVTYAQISEDNAAKTPTLQAHTKSFAGFYAHIIQHEVDHLNGIFFVDRLLQQNRKLYQLKGKDWVEITLV